MKTYGRNRSRTYFDCTQKHLLLFPDLLAQVALVAHFTDLVELGAGKRDRRSRFAGGFAHDIRSGTSADRSGQ